MFPISTSVPNRYPSVVTWLLIGSNAVVFLYQIGLPRRAQEAFVAVYGLIPARYAHPEWALQVGLDPSDYLPFLSTMFLHGGWFHILANMWTLWLFGDRVEDRLGSIRFLVFYLACGLAASGAHAWVNADSTVPAVGASGAIAGVLGAYMRLFPASRIVILVPIIIIPYFFELPAAIYIGLWFALQLAQGLFAGALPDAGGIAWWAHIGGFVAGVLLVPLVRQPERRYRRYYPDESLLDFRSDGRRW